MIVVVRQREIARQVDFDAMALADRDRRQNVEELVQNLRGRLENDPASRRLLSDLGRGAIGEGQRTLGVTGGSQRAR